MHGDTSGVNLHVSRVSKDSTLAVASDSSRCVTAHSVGREEVSVTITTCTNHHSVCSVAFDFTSHEVASDDTASATIDDHEVEHLIASIELHSASVHLAHERRVSTKEELLTSLTLSVESTAHLSTTERTVSEHTAVFASERYTLRHALVDDSVAHFSQTIHVSFTSAIVTTLYGVVEKTIYRVTVVLVVLCSVDTTLCSDRVCTARRVLDAEVLHFEAHFTERSSSTCTSKSSTYDDNIELTFVFGVHQLLVSFIVGPLLGHGAFGDARIQNSHLRNA